LISFVTFGSWGEIAPLLEIALQFKDEGLNTQFITTPEWADRVDLYGLKCHRVGKADTHSDGVSEFLGTRMLGQMESLAGEIEVAAAGSVMIVGAFYVWPGVIAAKRLGIEYRSTTTTPLYFTDPNPNVTFRQCVAEYYSLTGEMIPIEAICLTPWFFSGGGLPCPGYPRLREVGEVSAEVREFIEQPHAVITCGTMVKPEGLDDLVDQVHGIGLKCMYLGRHACKADLVSPFEPHASAVSKAVLCITHAGVGTTVDCLHAPMVVRPVAYDQHYNADKLIKLGAASTDVKTAMSIRPSLSSNWSLRAFARLL
jgi:hypothetical protein